MFLVAWVLKMHRRLGFEPVPRRMQWASVARTGASNWIWLSASDAMDGVLCGVQTHNCPNGGLERLRDRNATARCAPWAKMATVSESNQQNQHYNGKRKPKPRHSATGIEKSLIRTCLQCYLLNSLPGSSIKIGTMQRRLAWPLRKDDTLKSRSANISSSFPCWS